MALAIDLITKLQRMFDERRALQQKEEELDQAIEKTIRDSSLVESQKSQHR